MMEFAAYDRSPAYGRCNDKYGVSRQVMYDDRENRQNMLIPSLMFTQEVAGRAQEAMEFYTKLFPNAEIQSTWSYGKM